MNAPAHLRLFVYGTLKRGGRFHRAFCDGVLSIELASLRGRIRMLPAGYPSLSVPRGAILAEGSADAVADVATQDRCTPRAFDAETGWDEVRGELQTFDDPRLRLASIDVLEGFHPGKPSMYQRVLLTVRLDDDRAVTAWAYVDCPARADAPD